MKTSTAIVLRDPGAPDPPPAPPKPRLPPAFAKALKSAVRKVGGQALGNVADEVVKDLTNDEESDGLGSVGVGVLGKILSTLCTPGSEDAVMLDAISSGAFANAAAKATQSWAKKQQPEPLIEIAKEKLAPQKLTSNVRNTPEKRSRRHNRRAKGRSRP